MFRYGQREICNCVLKNITTGEPVLYLESLKVSSIEQGSTTVYARGGSGNPKILGWSSDKEITMKCEDSLISPESLAILAGTTVSSGDVSAHKKEYFIIGTTTGATVTGVTLSEIPVTGSVGADQFLYVASNSFSVGTPLTWTTAGTGTACYTFTGTHIALGTSTITTGQYLLTDYYFTTTGSKRIEIKSSNFAGYYKLEADTLWREEKTGTDFPALFTMPKIKLKDSFSLSMENTGDPKTFTFDMDVFANSDEQMVLIDIIE